MNAFAREGIDDPHQLRGVSSESGFLSRSSSAPSFLYWSPASFQSCTDVPESSTCKVDALGQNRPLLASCHFSQTPETLPHCAFSRQLPQSSCGEPGRAQRASSYPCASPSCSQWRFADGQSSDASQGTSSAQSDPSRPAFVPGMWQCRAPRRATTGSVGAGPSPNAVSARRDATQTPHCRRSRLVDFASRSTEIASPQTPENGSGSGARAPREASEQRLPPAQHSQPSSPLAPSYVNNRRDTFLFGVGRRGGVEQGDGEREGPSFLSPPDPAGEVAAVVTWARTLLPNPGAIWSRISDSVWRGAVILGGTGICCSCVSLLFLSLGFLSFAVLSAFVTPPPLAEFPIHFDYFPALSEALSSSPFVLENSPHVPSVASTSTTSPSNSSVPLPSSIQVNSTRSVSIPSSVLEGAELHGGSAVERRCSAEEIGPLRSYLCYPSFLDLFVPRSAQAHHSWSPWRGSGDGVSRPDAAADFDNPVSPAEFVDREHVSRERLARMPSQGTAETTRDVLWASYLLPGASSIAVAAVPFSNRSWEFLPADAQMYAPPAPFSFHGKTKGGRVSRMTYSSGREEDVPASFFAKLDASQLPADYNLDVYLTTSYPMNNWNSQLPPVMLSLLLFSSSHTPVAKATRSLLPDSPTDMTVQPASVVPLHSWTSWFSPSSLFSLFLPTFFRAPETRPPNVSTSLLFFEAFPFALTRRVKYAQVLMYPPLRASRAALVFVPKLHGFRAFLASHWTAAVFLLVLVLFSCCASCVCCGTLGLTYFVIPLGTNDADEGNTVHSLRESGNSATGRNPHPNGSRPAAAGSLRRSSSAWDPVQAQWPEGISRPREAVPSTGRGLVQGEKEGSRLMRGSRGLPANEGENHLCTEPQQQRPAPDVDEKGVADEHNCVEFLEQPGGERNDGEVETFPSAENKLGASAILRPSPARAGCGAGLELRRRRPTAIDD
ncbi:conserved hypothetical protein [Neospora caninum Liverpool]|uniref:Uncharacterized protein n=1 Tax=Neospora caninum (strain Liverpool) TaxID=572307 RepID=F0V7X6_NEOCL|nr:conserved hypothetical protein [Neospora caninum Liverpool]CBZ49817.1 conserved hypothetical protein [Neospora caninum Liverpool]CEL64406.1 TPA: hypothetical protein BN1204_003040 [Neospora caninum Liverpool]|eukprot:XP_003879852.1 conserved hypothetical protein [Neospora caninum Liverpool]